MEYLNLVISNNIFVLTVVMAVVIILLLIYLLVLNSNLKKLQKKYDFFMQHSADMNIDQILTKTIEDVREAHENLQVLQEKHQHLREQVKGCIQKVKIERYDAFDAMGGEMSYSILLADEKNDGVILTSIYGREENRCYAKDIKAGKSSYVLAEEEQKLL